MKKHILLLLLIITFPYIFCLLGSVFTDKFQIGQGSNSVEHNQLGKDVLIEINGLYKTMDVEEYVLGVLPGTISAEYDEETLKVQAILIRTNVLKEMEEKGSSDASDLSYQYLSIEERKELFGQRNFETYENKFEHAVVATAGKVLRQEGALIMALYHEVSIGKTASATEVLGEEIAYLQSVESSQDVEAKHYMNIVSYTWAELQEIDGKGTASSEESGALIEDGQVTEDDNKQGEESVAVQQEEKSKEVAKENVTTEQAESKQGENAKEQVKPQDIQVTEATENGFVVKLSVDGTIYTGDEAMKKYNLSSTNFYVEQIEGGVRFVCLGKGNCLGVSQYGANCMALSGKSYVDIIKYYYGNISMEEF